MIPVWNDVKHFLWQIQENSRLLIGISHTRSMRVILGSVVREETPGILPRMSVAGRSGGVGLNGRDMPIFK